MSLPVQEYLGSHTLDDLERELGVSAKRHESEPLVILNYSQIDSPKLHPVARNCRGLVLHADTLEVVAKGFDRFYNWGEHPEGQDAFVWEGSTATEKVDGSLILLHHWGGRWRVNTRNTFGEQSPAPGCPTWRGMCEAALGVSLDAFGCRLDVDLTYVCELTSPWNKVVQTHHEPSLWLLAAFGNGGEYDSEEFDADDVWFTWARKHNREFLKRPSTWEFAGIEDAIGRVRSESENDPTFEGVVLRDLNGARFKVKSPTYLALHRLKDNGNLMLPRNLLPFVLSGETGELLATFPEAEPPLKRVRDMVERWRQNLIGLWVIHKDEATQKEFALGVKHHPLAAVLFDMRKEHLFHPIDDAGEVWRFMRANERLLEKRLEESLKEINT